MGERIRHSGIVESIDGQHVKVRIVQTSACAGCRVSNHCNASENKVKEVDVFDSDAAKGLHVGDAVIVSASTAIAAKAMLYGFGVPLILLLVTIVTASMLSHSEPLAACLAIGVLFPYYLILYLWREKIGSVVAFEIETQN